MMEWRLVSGKLLRKGYTTGSAAAAAAKAAATMLFTQQDVSAVELVTPSGTVLTLQVENRGFTVDEAFAEIKKDGGDDPDITNGMPVYAHVRLTADDGITVKGGKGVGIVTKPGLDQPVGEHAINSVPRQSIRQACEDVCRTFGYEGGLSVVIELPRGEALAKRTFNPQLGIEGGLSILGTTGIVEPMSEKAIVETIRAKLSLLRQTGQTDVLFTVGNYAEAYAKDKLSLDTKTAVKCGNFIGDSLTGAAELGFTRALLIGHLGKLVKLSIGVTNTHSDHGDGRIEALLALSLEAGVPLSLLKAIQAAVSTDQAFMLISEAGLEARVMQLLTERVETTISRRVETHLKVGFIIYTGFGVDAAICAANQLANQLLEVFRL